MSIIRHEDGVYFGLPDSEYFKDPALGSTDLGNLLIAPAVYWSRSLYNPRRKDRSTRYTNRGHGLHSHVLFGAEHFHAHFERELQEEDYPDALVTMSDLKAALKQCGLAVSGNKPDLIARLKDRSSRFVIWDDMVDAQKASGRTILKADDHDHIIIASAMIKKNPSLATCFQDGMPEVSVFWTQDGVRFRVRFDYLRYASIVDLKSFSNSLEIDVGQAITKTFWNHGHDIQASHYLTGRQRMRELIREGRVFGDVDRDWLNEVAKNDAFNFVFVYYLMGDDGAAVTRGKVISPGQYVDGAASYDIGKAIEAWKTNYAIFGEDLWVDLEPLSEITQDDEPGWRRR